MRCAYLTPISLPQSEKSVVGSLPNGEAALAPEVVTYKYVYRVFEKFL